MSLARRDWPSTDAVAAAPKSRMPSQRLSIAGPRDAVQLIALQRLAGNRATSSLLAVQRCGPIPSDHCPCNEGAESDRQDMSEDSKGAPTAEQRGPSAAPLQAIEV
jgi:hypothetical protein